MAKMKQREDRSEKRKEIKEMIESRIDDEFANEQRMKAIKKRKENEAKRSENTFTDTFTEKAFGSNTVVVVTTSDGIDGEYNSDENEMDEFEDLARELRASIGDSLKKKSSDLSNAAKKSTKQQNKKKKKKNNTRKVKGAGKKQKKGHKARRRRR